MFVFYLIFVLIFFLVYYLKKKNQYWKIRGLPGPKPVLLFGNIKKSALRIDNFADELKNAYDEFPNEPLVGMYRMTSPCILVRDLDAIKHIMIKDFDKFQDRGVEYSKEGLGANLFHADGETWQVLRHKFSPLFTSAKLKNMVYLMNEKSDLIIEYLHDLLIEKSEQEVLNLFKRYTTASIASCIFGLEFDTISESLMNTLTKIDKLSLNCNFLKEIQKMCPKLFTITNTSILSNDVRNFFNDMVSDVIAKRNGVPSGRHDFMDLILKMREPKDVTVKQNDKVKDNDDLKLTITDGVIAAQAFVFFVAGYETSATVLSYLMYELALNAKIQDKFIEEIDDVLQKHNGDITYESVSNNPYMEKVFHEVNRKYPLGHLQRKSNADYNIPGTKCVLEKGTVVLVSNFGIHHDEKYYPEPDKFDPERFSPENIRNRHSCAYLPYGIGPRNCIGIRFGNLQTRIFAMKFFSKYRVEPSEKSKTLKIDPRRIFVAPFGGMYVNIFPRKIKEK